MNTHQLKTWSAHFDELWAGRKTFELRHEVERRFKRGDFLLLLETESATCERFTGRVIVAEVTHLLRGPSFGLRAGAVCLSLHVGGKHVIDRAHLPFHKPTPAAAALTSSARVDRPLPGESQ